MSGLRIHTLSGAAIAEGFDALATVRIAVFRDWPYLYEGTLEYERRYLEAYARAPHSLAILVWDGAHCVGASTAVPLAEAGEAAQAPFRGSSHDIARIDYFGESILLPPYRGRGLGVRFFALREAHARALGLSTCAFCAVERPEGHPARPADYVPNDAFWVRRGYRKAAGIRTDFSWTDVGETASTPKPMAFWLRELEPAVTGPAA